MIERELIFLLGYTAVVSFFSWLTFKIVAHTRANSDEEWCYGAVSLLMCFWALYFCVAAVGEGFYLPTTLWLDWFESRGILYSSGAFNK